MKTKKVLSIFYFLCLFYSTFSQTPLEWDTVKSEQITRLNQVLPEIINRWDGQPYCTHFACDLALANSQRGYSLFTPDPVNYPYPIPAYQNALYAYIDTMLMAFDSVGFTGVVMAIQYPSLATGFANRQYYIDFYQTVIQKLRAKNYQISIGCQATFMDSTWSEANLLEDIKQHIFNPDHNPLTNDTLTQQRFKAEKLDMFQTIIDSLQPDYLTMEMEPQTQYENLYHLVNYSTDSMISMINYYLDHLNPAITKLGAGAGTWDDEDYFVQIAQTGIDFIDYHIYPPNYDFIDNMAFLIDSFAELYNKELIIGESWDYKMTQYEMSVMTNPIANSPLIYSRDYFDYWTELDTLFVNAMYLLTQQSKVEFCQFMWPYLLFGQLSYDPSIHGIMTPQQIINAGRNTGSAMMHQFQLSPIGGHIKDVLENHCIPNNIKDIKSSFFAYIYPNPSTGLIHIISNSEIDQLSVVDITGRIVNQYLFEASRQKEVSISLPKGIYLLFVQSKNEKKCYKTIITQ